MIIDILISNLVWIAVLSVSVSVFAIYLNVKKVNSATHIHNALISTSQKKVGEVFLSHVYSSGELKETIDKSRNEDNS